MTVAIFSNWAQIRLNKRGVWHFWIQPVDTLIIIHERLFERVDFAKKVAKQNYQACKKLQCKFVIINYIIYHTN